MNAGDEVPDDQQLDQLLAEADGTGAVPTDSTNRKLLAELETLALDLRRPVSPDPHQDEAACARAVELACRVVREVAPELVGANAAEPGAPSELGEIGPYKLLELLGQGGMGTVYKALHPRLDKVVALKVLPAERLKNDDALGRFQREMKAIGKLDHPHLIRALDAGEADGTHYLVMDFVAGMDLAALLKQRGPLPIAEACELVAQGALGLQAAHSRGMVHRDIKPANLMLATQEFGPPVVKVLDLGLALLSGSQAVETGSLTSESQIMGTIDFMAPEQASNSHSVDVRADVYSLGATLFALLTGGSIFADRPDRTLMQKLSALANEPAPSVRSRRDDVSEALAGVVHRMLARKPGERFASMADVVAVLKPLSDGANLAALLSTESKAATDGEAVVANDLGLNLAATLPPCEAADHSSDDAKVGKLARIRPQTQTEIWRVRRRRTAIALAGVVLLGAILLSLKTPNGEVIVEVPDGVPVEMQKQLKIQVLGNGEAQVADEANGWKIGITEGKYDIQLSGGGDRLEIKENQVTVTRRKQTFVKVTFKPAGHVVPTEGMPASTQIPADPDRRAAEWVCSIGGSVGVNDQARVGTAAELPREKFRLTNIALSENPLVSDAGLANFQGCQHLTHLYLQNAKVSDVGLANFRDYKTLIILNLSGTQVSDAGLAVFKACYFSHLNLSNTKVSDAGLAHFQNLSSLSLLRLSDTAVTDAGLARFGACPNLEILDLAGTQVTDAGLASFKDCTKLTNLGLHRTKVTDLTPLKGLPLTELQFSSTQVSDLSPLKGMKLVALSCYETPVSGLTPLEGMPLIGLSIQQTEVSNLSPLKGMKLGWLHCGTTRITDLSPLAGMPLVELSVSHCWPKQSQAIDLSPLRGMPLERLDLFSTHVTDLTPLAELPLKRLDLGQIFPADLSPLKGLRLETLTAQPRLFHAADEQVVRSLPLKFLNRLNDDKTPVAEAWQRIEARRETIRVFAAQAKELPADQQIAAVRAKLNEWSAYGFNGEFNPRLESDTVTAVTIDVNNDGYVDLSALVALPSLKHLTLLNATAYHDLSPLTLLPLETLTCPVPLAEQSALVLREIKSLKTINEK